MRYGEWYTGNDTDLDEHLLEYNAEQATAALASEDGQARRKSALVSCTADTEDSDFTDDEAETTVKSCQMRRNTLAPGQGKFPKVCTATPSCFCLCASACPLWSACIR